MSDLAAYPPQPAYQDRSTGLTLVGILEICLALLCLLLLFFMAMTTLALATAPAGQAAGMNTRSMLGAGMVYLLAGVYFAVLGVGTLRGRRWARTIGLVTAWIWLIIGIFSVVILILILPKMMAGISAAAGGSAKDGGIGACATGCVTIVMFLIYLVMPGLLVLFYRGSNVRATFEARDPSIPWTDRVPAPVLALTLLLALGAVGALMGLSYAIFPLFGSILTGAPAILGFLVMGALCAALAWGVYNRRLAAWWACIVFGLLGCVNGAFLLRGGSLRRMYEAMKMPAAQLQQIESTGLLEMYSRPAVQILIAVMWLGGLGFLIWMRRFFAGASERSGG